MVGPGIIVKVQDLMTKDVVTAKTDNTVADVAKKMTERNVGSVIIVENDQVKGIVTDREIVVHGIGKGNNPTEQRVTEIMHENPVTCKPDDTIWKAAELTYTKGARAFRRLPVVDDDNKLVGVIGVADFALVAHPLLEAVLTEAQASVEEAKVDQLDLKRQIERRLPNEVSPTRA